MFAAMDEAHSLEDLAAAAQGGLLVRTILYSLLFGWQLFRAVMTAIEMGGWDTQSLLRFRAFVYTATMLPVVILAGRMTAAPVSDPVAWGAAIASGLRACMACGRDPAPDVWPHCLRGAKPGLVPRHPNAGNSQYSVRPESFAPCRQSFWSLRQELHRRSGSRNTSPPTT